MVLFVKLYTHQDDTVGICTCHCTIIHFQNSSRNISFEVGEDRLVLKTRPNLFYLDVDLPYLVNNEETGAQFDRERKVLTATLAVTGKYKRHHCDPA